MSDDVRIETHVSEEVQQQASEVLELFGLSMSDLLRMTVTHVAKEKMLPFSLMPNAETIASIEASEAGVGLTAADDLGALFSKLRM